MRHKLAMLADGKFTPAALKTLISIQDEVAEQVAKSKSQELTALETSDREDQIGDWLDEHGIASAWDYAPTFVEAGLDVDWLGNPWAARAAILLTNLWLGFPYMFIICTGALQAIPADVKEAAAMDGAGWWAQFRIITIPLLQPSIVVVLVLATIHGFQSFDFIWTLTGGGPVGATTLMVQYIYENGFQSPIRLGIAAAGGIGPPSKIRRGNETCPDRTRESAVTISSGLADFGM